ICEARAHAEEEGFVRRARLRAVPVAALALLLGASPGPIAAESRKTELPNGLTVLVNENPAAPLVAVSLFIRVGTRWETADDAGITTLLQQVLAKGTTSRSALEIALAAERIGGGLGAAGGADGSALRAHYERYYRAGRMILSVSGDVSNAEVVTEAARLFSESPPGAGGPDAAVPAVAGAPGRVGVAHPSAQAQVLMAFLAPSV